MPEAVIVDTLRSPIGRAFKGSLAQLRPEETGAFVIDKLLERNPDLDPNIVQDVICGCGMPQGLQAFNIARIMVLLSENLPETTTGVTVSRYCASSLDAVRHASNAIKNGEGDAYIAAGVEFVSRFNERTEPAGCRRPQREADRRARGLPERLHRHGRHRCQRRQEVRRQSRRHGRLRAALPAPRRRVSGLGLLRPRDRRDPRARRQRDRPRTTARAATRATCARSSAGLHEAFEGGGGVTAGNSCPLNDGAAAVLVMSDTKAKELGLKPRARIITAATEGNNPEYMGVAPIGAVKKVLDRAGMTIGDIDAVELNEAFAAQVIPIMDECEIPLEKLNTHGGAIALGHPFGMTGARIMGTLLNVMETDDHQVGLETMCVAGGQGEAMIVERL